MGPLQREITTLVAAGYATNHDLFWQLNQHYSISQETIRVTLWRLTKRGILIRQARGVYAANDYTTNNPNRRDARVYVSITSGTFDDRSVD